ncbi:MAG: helix-hairpin-helix domain-containing protein [Chloroflexota bacterium]|nr:helix-hairpin-helix domain-containing protein [Chloroflexota bacterium]
MKLSAGVLLIAAVVISFAVAVVTFVAVDRFMQPDIVGEPPQPRDITVEVTGGVATPGVVTVPDSSRLQQVVDAAGGFGPDADVTSLNMAGRVGDGEEIVIPVIKSNDAELASPSTSTAMADDPPADVPDVPATASSTSSDALLDVNTASQDELEALPRIGPVLAGRIIAYRTENGPFTSVEQLVNVEGISTSTVDELRPYISVDG